MRTGCNSASRRRMVRAFAWAASACLLAVVSAAAQQGWVVERRGPAGKDLNAVYFADSKRGWVGGDEGLVLRTEDGGRTWEQQPSGVADGVNDIYFRDKEDGYLLAANRVMLTEDGGRTWRAQTSGVESDLRDVKFVDAREGWAVGGEGSILHTTDGGATWRAERPVTPHTLERLFLAGRTRGWAVGFGGTIIGLVNRES